MASQAAQRVLRHRVLYRGGELVNAVLRRMPRRSDGEADRLHQLPVLCLRCALLVPGFMHTREQLVKHTLPRL